MDSQDEDEDPLLGSLSRQTRNSSLRDGPPMLYLLTGLAVVGGFLFGYDTGVVSGAMLLVRREWELTDMWHSLIVSATIFAAFLSSLVTGLLSDLWGRKPVILLASINFLLASIIMGLAPEKGSLLFGRLLAGVGVGLASTTVPVYISECSIKEIRGELVTVNNLAITGGQMIAGVVCGLITAVSNQPDSSWRWMLGLATLPAAVQLVGFIFMPESPRFLVAKQRFDEAEKVLRSIRGPHHQIREELEDMKIASRHQETPGKAVVLKMLREKGARATLIIGCVLQLTQQLAGINTVMYYAASILSLVGSGPQASIWLSAVTAAANFLFTLLGLKLVGLLPRRRLLLSSMLGVIFSLCLIAAGFKFMGSTEAGNGWRAAYVLIPICIYVAFFAPGLGPLPWIINSELHPGWCRAPATSLATATNWMSNLVISLTFLPLISALGSATVFLVYSLLTALGAAFLALSLPETKGLALEEMETIVARELRYQRVSLHDQEED